MPTAEIIAIGTELLLGVTQDTNTSFLAKELNRLGIDVYRSTIIGDNPTRITQAIQEASIRAEILITSGGLGPTVDDPTRQAVADAFHQPLVFHPDLWEAIQARFKRAGRIVSENNKRQAFIPENARVIENKVGTAPSFYIENNNRIIISLPGVPAELKFLFQTALVPLLQRKYGLHQIIYSKIIHTSGMGESLVDEALADLEELTNPTVGLTAHPAMVDIRITVKAADSKHAIQTIEPLLQTIQKRLGDNIFGYDDEKLVDSVIKQKNNLKNPINLCLTSQAIQYKEQFERLLLFETICMSSENNDLEAEFLRSCGKNNPYIMGLDLSKYENTTTVNLYWYDLHQWTVEKKVFSSHPTLFEAWLINSMLDHLRRKIAPKETK